jgi:hypothetical protein
MLVVGKYPRFIPKQFPVNFAYSEERAITVMDRPTLNGRFRQQADLCQSFDSDVCDWRNLRNDPVVPGRGNGLAGAGPFQDAGA